LLVSEALLESQPDVIAQLAQQFGFQCIDCPLEDPVTIAITDDVCVCLIDSDLLLCDSHALKDYVKSLTRIVFKWSTVWLILQHTRHSARNNTRNTDYCVAMCTDLLVDLYAATSRFPCAFVIREADTLAAVTSLIYSAVKSAITPPEAADRTIRGVLNKKHAVDREQFPRLIVCLENEMFRAQCDFLQLFPCINYYQACILLSGTTLSRLPLIEFTRNNLSLYSTTYDRTASISTQAFGAELANTSIKGSKATTDLEESRENYKLKLAALLSVHVGLVFQS
jgi:hypothetical protein